MTLTGTSFSMVSAEVFHWSTRILMLLTSPLPQPQTVSPHSSPTQNTSLKPKLPRSLLVATMYGVTHIPLLSVPFQLFPNRMVAFGSSMTWADLSLQGLMPMLPRTHVNIKPLTKSSIPYILDILWRWSTWNPPIDLYTLSPRSIVLLACGGGSLVMRMLPWCVTPDYHLDLAIHPQFLTRLLKLLFMPWTPGGMILWLIWMTLLSQALISIAALDAHIILLRSLRFHINWAKIRDPSQSVTFLGVNIDSVAGELSLKPDKLQEVLAIIRDFQRRCRASRKQLERLASKLIWASHMTPWSRSHVKSVYSLISTLKLPGHKRLWVPIQLDLTWWATWLSTGRNRHCIWPLQTTIDMYSDACPLAGRAFCQGLYSQWARDCPKLMPHHINTKELAAIVLAALRWRYKWQEHHIIVHTNSTVTQGIINKGSARNMTSIPPTTAG